LGPQEIGKIRRSRFDSEVIHELVERASTARRRAEFLSQQLHQNLHTVEDLILATAPPPAVEAPAPVKALRVPRRRIANPTAPVFTA
jgi:hypothetical protein